MNDATRAVRTGLTEPVTGAPIHAGPVFVSTFHTPQDVTTGYTYARSHQPTWTSLERAIGELEVNDGHTPAEVCLFGSGLAAVAAAFWTTLGPGDTVVVPSGLYFGARSVLAEMFEPIGVTVRVLAPAEMNDAGQLTGAKLVWVETPGNPGLEITDIRGVVAAAKQAGALVAVDNTTATPFGQRPLELGADLSVCSDSKAMSGHSDLLLGHVASHHVKLMARVDRYRTLGGAIAGPMEAWLALRSLATLPLRLERMSANALALAKYLQGRTEVRDVLYPGLPEHCGHMIAGAQMRYFGPVLSFTLGDKETAQRFLTATQLVTETTSFGGVTTSAERRARWGGDAVPEGFIRMSAGCEDVADLIEDVGRALDGI